ncbi:hypothetical protein BpHYR1_023395 [Brachionus plicatilis]|uniref:Uncharacterized protein n=1 Tax=Brachionus plicatilis TaxID=10195 RepID=A0A3M7Q867_BRAPC|nr:hypothetical protein BpHYR1_023395 [Brachionus plicatilis]
MGTGKKISNQKYDYELQDVMDSENILEDFLTKFDKKFGHLKKQPAHSLIPQQKSPNDKLHTYLYIDACTN